MSSAEQFGVQVGSEVAKAVGEAAREAITNLIGPPTKEAGMLAGDLIANWRAGNLVRIYKKFLLETDGLELPAEALKRLPFGFRELVLEQGSREDQPCLQDAWARLLATSVEQGYLEAHKSYANDIQSLTPLGAFILVAISKQGGASSPDKLDTEVLLASTRDLVERSDAEIEAALAILLKLGMLNVFPDKLDNWDVGSLNENFGDDVGALANAVRLILLDTVERSAFEPTKKYRTIDLSGHKVMWFEMWLSPYGENFYSACIEES